MVKCIMLDLSIWLSWWVWGGLSGWFEKEVGFIGLFELGGELIGCAVWIEAVIPQIATYLKK